DGEAGEGVEAGHAGNVEDEPFVLPLEDWPGSGREVDDRRQVGVDALPPNFRRDIGYLQVGGVAGDVGEHVESAERFGSGLHRRVAELRVLDVAGNDEHFDTG